MDNLNEQTDFETTYMESCFGRDEVTNYANCEISGSLMELVGDVSNPDDVSIISNISRHTVQAEFKLSTRGDFACIDLVWSSALDPDLRLFWYLLEDYGKKADSVLDYNNPNEAKPLLTFMIFSNEYMDRGYLTFSNPIFWGLLPEVFGDKASKGIRLFISMDTITFTETDPEIAQQIIHDESANANRRENVIYSENERSYS